MTVETKVCATCHAEKPKTEFYPRKDRPVGVSPRCRECDRARVRKDARKDWPRYLERARESAANRRRTDPDKARRLARESYGRAVQNPERRATIRSAVRGYYQANKARLAEAGKRWEEKNRAKVREAKRRYEATERGQDVKRHSRHLRRARLGGVLSTADMAARARILKAAAGICAYCTRPGKLTLDHIYPIARGGIDDAGNMAAACSTCNASKAARDPIAWASRRFGPEGRARIAAALARPPQ